MRPPAKPSQAQIGQAGPGLRSGLQWLMAWLNPCRPKPGHTSHSLYDLIWKSCLGLVHQVSPGVKAPLAQSVSTTSTDNLLIVPSTMLCGMSHLLYIIVSPFFHVCAIRNPSAGLALCPTRMASLEEIHLLVKNITTLSSSLPPSFPKANSKDKIWTVMHSPECDTPFKTFNKHFDALFAEDCRNPEGCLDEIRQGKSGMGLVSSYLKRTDWSAFPLNLVKIKLEHFSAELKYLVDSVIFLSPLFNLTGSSESNVSEPKTVRQSNPASRLRDADNVQQAGLSFQRKAVATFQIRGEPNLQPHEASADSAHSSPLYHALDGESSPASSLASNPAPSSQAEATTAHPKRPLSLLIAVDSNDETETDAQPKPSMSFVLVAIIIHADRHLSQKEMRKTQQPSGKGPRRFFDGR